MSDTITVREHRRACEHGSLWPHWFEMRKARWWREPDCPGGREKTWRESTTAYGRKSKTAATTGLDRGGEKVALRPWW